MTLTGIALPQCAGDGELSFLSDGREAYAGGAGAVLTAVAARLPSATIGIIVPHPLLACARAASWLPVRMEHAVSMGTPSPRIDSTADIAPGCVIEAGAVIGAYSRLGPWCRVGRNALIGDYCVLAARVSIEDGVTLGNRVSVEAGTVIGASAFVALRDGEQWVRFPAFSGVTVQNDVSIGPNCTIARGVFRATNLGYRVCVDAQVHIGHDCDIGADTIIAGGTTLAGGVIMGAACVLGGRVAVAEGIAIASRVTITAMSLVTKSITDTGTHWSGAWPVQRSTSWWRSIAQWRRRSQVDRRVN
jgi:UDP-3-O-[3-hydroxymyristoyl] glucosamine N-acyltransferase